MRSAGGVRVGGKAACGRRRELHRRVVVPLLFPPALATNGFSYETPARNSSSFSVAVWIGSPRSCVRSLLSYAFFFFLYINISFFFFSFIVSRATVVCKRRKGLTVNNGHRLNPLRVSSSFFTVVVALSSLFHQLDSTCRNRTL